MTGRLLIDGSDAYKDYGVYVVSGGWNELVAWPSLKSVDYNDWQEENGIEVDLSSPKLDTKSLSIKFAITSQNGYTDLVSKLTGSTYHLFNCKEIGAEFKLRVTQLPSLDSVTTLGFASIKFADDFPLHDYDYRAPVKTISDLSSYKIDTYALSSYNIMVLKGSISEVMKMPAVKEALLRNIATQTGVIYDEKSPIKLKSKDVKLQCLMRASNLSDLWRNWNALLYDLTREKARVLSTPAGAYNCYYKGCSVSEFYPSERIWLKFTLTLTFIDGSMASKYNS